MHLQLELIPVPVADIDRAKQFYVEQAGFALDHDVRPSATVRVVQLTPPGSACSIVLGEGMPGLLMPAGSLRGLHLVVANMAEARAELAGRGVAMGEVQDLGGIQYAGFADPDGNTWTLQEMPARPGLTPPQIAEAFSTHRFDAVYPHLADHVQWEAVGASPTVGKPAVVAACRQAAAEMAATTSHIRRLTTVVGEQAVVVDSVVGYAGGGQPDCTVASCDIYEFQAGLVAKITSYAVELPRA